MSTSGLKAIQLSKSYNVDSRQITVLDNVSITVQVGEFVVIEGKSGRGAIEGQSGTSFRL